MASKAAPQKLKLYYFRSPGRSDGIQLALRFGKIPYEFVGIDRTKFSELKGEGKWPFDGVPVLEIGEGEKVLAQSRAIIRYVGRLSGLYPTDPWEAAQVDEAIEVEAEDIEKILVSMFTPATTDEEKKATEKALKENHLPRYLKRITQLLQRRNSGFVAGDKLTVADLNFIPMLQWMSSPEATYGINVVFKDYPAVEEYIKRFSDMPEVKKYYEDMKN